MEVEAATTQRQPCKNAITTKQQQQQQQQLSTGRLFRSPLLVVNFVLMVVGSACGPLLLRAYFLRGGNRKWLSSLLQTAGWPLLLAPLCFSYSSRRRRREVEDDGAGAGAAATPLFLMTPRLLVASAVVGLMTGVDDLLYAYGLAYLPVSTSSILISTQLAFNGGFRAAARAPAVHGVLGERRRAAQRRRGDAGDERRRGPAGGGVARAVLGRFRLDVCRRGAVRARAPRHGAQPRRIKPPRAAPSRTRSSWRCSSSSASSPRPSAPSACSSTTIST
ncbi:hypothetical protein OsJ_29686 [Oryza sativa Japonica Group]|uniref:Uncharacterized protein n=1 Tax=Oryza sativa subsp. japonica TaxID=39947 RepID=B9G424_ORYSJ|nr:hypothetical protein OsJ_29686 [Oryza sativa Japonica Group]